MNVRGMDQEFYDLTERFYNAAWNYRHHYDPQSVVAELDVAGRELGWALAERRGKNTTPDPFADPPAATTGKEGE